MKDNWQENDPPLAAYPFVVRPLAKDEGGGFLIEFPDVPGVLSDSETTEEAIENGRDALKSAHHARLVERAKLEGVSLNTLVTAMIAEGLGQRHGQRRLAQPALKR